MSVIKFSGRSWAKKLGVAAVSELEEMLLLQIHLAGLPIPHREYNFCPGRRYRMDFAWPDHGKVGVECQGGIWTSGRHTSGAGFEAECERRNEATLLGWRVLECTANHIKSGKALQWLERALEAV